ncbi:MAG TPA: RNA polymerase sigma-70 factor [Puia sp.]
MEQKSPQHTFSITGFREGSEQDFKHTYELYYDTIYTFAYNLIGKEDEAQDITTDTFVKLWRLHANFESLRNIQAFLYVTNRNACLDYLRHLKFERKTHKKIRYSQKVVELMPNEMIDVEVFIELDRQIEQLPNKCRKIFKLIYHNNLSTSEVAQEMGISNQNVLNQKARAIHILRAGLLQKFILPLPLTLLIFLLLFSQ